MTEPEPLSIWIRKMVKENKSPHQRIEATEGRLQATHMMKEGKVYYVKPEEEEEFYGSFRHKKSRYSDDYIEGLLH